MLLLPAIGLTYFEMKHLTIKSQPTVSVSIQLMMFGMALAFWLLARPFYGIWHDGAFYALQALLHLNPSIFSQDLFFLYGSQDQYSLFSHIYAAAVSLWGLSLGTTVLQGVGLGLWLVAAWALTRILPDKLAPVGLLLIVSVGGSYGSHGVFAYGESFLSARLFAEAFSLAGLAAWLAGRRTWGGAAFFAACAIHPLMALPAIMIGMGTQLRPKIWFCFIGICALLVLGLGFSGVQPFTGLVQPMDAVWWDLAVARSPFVFLHAWGWEGFSRALFVIVVTGTAWRVLPESQLRRLAWATLVCVLGAFVITYLGGSLLKLPLVAGLQLTRVMWIGLVITLVLLPAMVWHGRQGAFWDRALAWGLALAVFVDIKSQGGYAILVLTITYLGMRHFPTYKPPTWLLILFGLVPLQVMLWGLLNVRIDAELAGFFSEDIVWRGYFVNPATALTLVVGAYLLLARDRLSKYWVWGGSAVVAGLILLAMTTWYDLQPRLNYGSPSRQAAIAPIVALVPENALVYWVESPHLAWFWLGRANYLSFSSTAGSLFARGTAVEALRRAPYVRPSSQRDANQTWDQRLSIKRAQPVSPFAVQQACRDPILDYVIAQSQPSIGLVYFSDPITGLGYGLYDCRATRGPISTVSTSNAVDVQERIRRNL